eukprot:TRINITY_DN3982_c0_g1_i3.p1 TRINITY_DN3982_c0_g1~~TRINITY_DN3982_c0_g1_i3.p1  ORF type:complete len:1455 (-),score=351.96 TRINITY_DN3982_c0_g1_i3:19-4158(-)
MQLKTQIAVFRLVSQGKPIPPQFVSALNGPPHLVAAAQQQYALAQAQAQSQAQGQAQGQAQAPQQMQHAQAPVVSVPNPVPQVLQPAGAMPTQVPMPHPQISSARPLGPQGVVLAPHAPPVYRQLQGPAVSAPTPSPADADVKVRPPAPTGPRPPVSQEEINQLPFVSPEVIKYRHSAPQIATLPLGRLPRERDDRMKAQIQALFLKTSPTPKDLFEQRRLRVLAMQHNLRTGVLRMNFAHPLNVERIEIYRRPETVPMSMNSDQDNAIEARNELALQAERRREKFARFFSSVLNHQINFAEFHKTVANNLKNLLKDLLRKHAKLEKQRWKSAEPEVYEAMLKDKKQERLDFLLRQTDMYLQQIGAKVHEEKLKAAEKRKTEKRERRIRRRLRRERAKAELQKAAEDASGAPKPEADPDAAENLKEEEPQDPSQTVDPEPNPAQTKPSRKRKRESAAEATAAPTEAEKPEFEDSSDLDETDTSSESGDDDDDDDGEDDGAPAETEGQLAEGEGAGDGAAERRRYYTIAHTIQEEITQQPECLIGGLLKPYQIEGLQWLVSLYNNNLNGVLADEMGLGKTIQTISLVCYLMEKKKNMGPFLVVVPLVTISNWQSEFNRWAPSVKTVSYVGHPSSRKKVQRENITPRRFNVLITTYEYCLKDKSVLSKVKWDYIVIDEGHRMKNHKSRLATTMAQYTSKHRLLLTGTPLQNSLPELWSLLNFLLPTIFNSVENFEAWFNAPFANVGTQVMCSEEETLAIINRLHQVLRPFLLRRLKKDVESQLPDKVEKILKCELSGLQKRIYRNIQDFASVTVTDGKRLPLQHKTMQLRKICNHPYLFLVDQVSEPQNYTQHYPNVIRASGKFRLLDNILHKLKVTGHRVLLFSQFTEIMEIFERMFIMRGYHYLRLDGNTKHEDRGNLLAKFNAASSDYFLFILSTRAGGVGLNLQTADTVIIFDSDWNPHMDLQAQDRAHRIGQTKEVRVFRLVTAGTVEERILETARHKLDMDKKIIQAGMFNTTATNEERNLKLQDALMEKGYEQPLELPSLREINEMIARSPEEFAQFEEVDKVIQQEEQEAWREANLPAQPSLLMDENEYDVDHLFREPPRNGTVDFLADLPEERRARQLTTSYADISDAKFIKMIEAAEEEPDRKRRRTEAEPKEAKPLSKHMLKKMRLQQPTDQDSQTGALRSASPAPVSQKIKIKVRASAPPPNTTPTVVHNIPDSAELLGDPRLDIEYDLEILKKVMGQVLDDVVDYEIDKRKVSYPFEELPSREEYPDYFQIIPEANLMSLDCLDKMIDDGKFTNLRMFFSAFRQMIVNATLYNRPDSVIYSDALAFKTFFDQCLFLQMDKLPTPAEAEEDDVVLRRKKIRVRKVEADS